MVFLSDDQAKADGLQAIYDQIARDSQLGELQSEAGLMMQIRGGSVFQVLWEPGNKFAQYGIRIVTRPSATIWPVFDPTDPCIYWSVTSATRSAPRKRARGIS